MDAEQYDISFGQAIGYVCISVGIKTIPDEILYSSLKRSFSYFDHVTPDEFQMAFELNSIGELGERIQHYQLFSVEFLSDVVKRYISMRDDTIVEFSRLCEPTEAEFSHNTPEEYYDRLLKYVTEKKEVPLFWNWQAVFRHMRDIGFVTEDDAWKKLFRDDVQKIIENEKTVSFLKRVTMANQPFEDRVKEEYVKMKMRMYLDGECSELSLSV
jgi:hypothetical protein